MESDLHFFNVTAPTHPKKPRKVINFLETLSKSAFVWC